MLRWAYNRYKITKNIANIQIFTRFYIKNRMQIIKLLHPRAYFRSTYPTIYHYL